MKNNMEISQEAINEYIKMAVEFGLVDKSVTCKECGALHSPYYKECPRCNEIDVKEDKIVNNVINEFRFRSSVGIRKYGTTLAESSLNVLEWLQHLQEELMDATLYIEKLKSEIHESKT